MKKFTLWKSLFLLFALIVGSASVWATDVDLKLGSNNQSSLSGTLSSKINWSLAKGSGSEAPAHTNATYSKIYDGNTITISAVNSSTTTITKVVLKAQSGYIKTWSASDNSTVSVSGDNATWSGSASTITLTNNAGAQARINTITITYTEVVAPIINASSPVNYAADITSGEIPYTISNAVSGKTLSATSNDDWISSISVVAEKVTFYMSENTGEAREGKITLSYDGATSKDITINQAAFIAKHTVTINDCENGTLQVLRGDNNVASGAEIPEGTTLTICATPDPGYRFQNWQYYTTKWNTRYTNNQNFDMPESDVTFRANFELIPSYTLSYVVDPVGAGNVTLGATSILEGSSTTIEATANAGYKFTGWTISGTGATIEDADAASTTMTIGTADATVTANFEAVTTYPIHWSVNGEIVKTENVEENTAINFAAPTSGVPAGYEFRGWVEEANKIDTPTDEDPSANYVSSANSTAEITYFAVMAVVTGTTLESWEEEDLANMTASDIFVFSNGSYALNNDNGTGSAPDMNSITVSNKKITSTVTDKLKWQVSGNATDGYIFYPNGDDETWLYCNTTASSSSNNNIRVGVGTRKLWAFTQSGYLKTKDSYTTRYLCVYGTQDFRGYTGTDNAFVPKFYKYIAPTNIYKNYCTSVPSATVTITDLSSVTGSTYTGKNYATMYYSDKAFAIPAGVVAKTYKMEGGVLTESRTYELGGENPVIPAGEAVVVESDAGAIYEFSEVVSSASVDENNALCGTDAATTVNTAGYKYYKLAMNDGLDKVGFFFDNADGSAINNGAHKAYLRVSTNSDAKNFYLFDNTVTGINTLDNLTNSQMDNDAPMYNLAGQRVNKSYKGVVIVNGKKLLNK